VRFELFVEYAESPEYIAPTNKGPALKLPPNGKRSAGQLQANIGDAAAGSGESVKTM
jgi:hypothetical protein